MIELLKKYNIWQFVKFGVVGLSNTIIGYIIYVVSLLIFRNFKLFNNIDIYIAQFIMFLLSVLWSYYWNSKKVFVNKKESFIKSLLKTYIAYAFSSLILSEFLLYIWTKLFNISDLIAPLLSLIITVPTNYLIHKYWVFNENN